MDIYIQRNGQHFGPYSVTEAKEQLATGRLRIDDLAWRDGEAGWTPLGKIKVVAKPIPSFVPPRREGASPSRMTRRLNPKRLPGAN